MARFFQNFEDEKKETKKKINNIINEPETKMSKKDKKISELEAAVDEVLKSKNFEKNFKKFMNDLKKYNAFLDNREILNIITTLLDDDRIIKSKPCKILADEFRNSITTEVEKDSELVENTKDDLRNDDGKISIVEKSQSNITNARQETLAQILEITDLHEKEQKLLKYLSNQISPEEKSSISIALYSIYSRRSDAENMIKALLSSDISEDGFYSGIIKKNIDKYLQKIYDNLNDNLNEEYYKLLEKFKLYFPEIVDHRILEYKFYKLSLSPENDNLYFKLLKLIRDNQYEKAKDYFISNELSSSDVMINIMYELGSLAAKNGDFEFAFDLFVKIEKSEKIDLKKEIFCLCVILNHKIKETSVFEDFIENFKSFDRNIFVLESSDQINEIYRSFYLFNMLDYKSSATIIKNICGFDCEKQLKDSVKELVKYSQ